MKRQKMSAPQFCGRVDQRVKRPACKRYFRRDKTPAAPMRDEPEPPTADAPVEEVVKEEAENGR